MKYPEYTIKSTKNARVLILTDIHYCHKNWYGATSEERMELMCDALQKEYENKNFDCILCLGDYSLDFWKWERGGSYLLTPPISHTDEFMKKYYPRFPAKAYIIPGNHEQYGADKWKEITGFDREYSLVYGNYIFAMADTFAANLDPTENSDGTYSGLNTEFLKEILNNHPDKKILLFAHYFDPDKESDEAKEILAKEKNIQGIFVGHRHLSTTVFLDESWRNLPVIFCGNFSYHRPGANDLSEYFGNVFASLASETDGQWGYRILDLQGGLLRTDYVHITPEKHD